MPLYHAIRQPDFMLGVWKLTESIDQLQAILPFEVTDEAKRRFSAPHRRLEWLGARVLLQTMLGQLPAIAYYDSGRPYLPAMPEKSISISHTKGYVAVMVGNGVVGIDIEQVSDRVHKVASRFIRDDEAAPDTCRLLLHWSAKEAMYKCLDSSAVDFREHLRIFPFTLQTEGRFDACEYRTPAGTNFVVHYKVDPDFVLTYIAG